MRIASAFFLSLLVFVSMAGCRPGTRYQYTGRVYDGLTMQPLKSYTIELRWGDSVVRGKVDKDGVYSLGELPSFTDFSLSIIAPDYRAFLSNNFAEPENTTNDGTRVENVSIIRYRDAYLFPSSATAPASTVNVFLPDSIDRPSGTALFRASAASQLETQPVAVYTAASTTVSNSARWSNSLDLQQPAVSKDFTGGVITLDAGDLVLGVNYSIVIMGVANYQYNTGTTFLAGQSNNTAITLDRLSTPADDTLMWVRTNLQDGVLVPNGDFIITFNGPVELDPSVSQARYDQIVKDNLSITSLDLNGGSINSLPATGTNPDPRNVVIAGVKVMGNQMIFSSTLSGATLATTDPQDPIVSVTYGGLGNFKVRLQGRTDESFVALAGVLEQVNTGTTLPGSETVPLTSVPANP